jgi:hypothetical protein
VVGSKGLGYRIFISSTMVDLAEERHNIAYEVMRSENIPVMAEYKYNVLDPPRVALVKEIDKCDGFIGVFHKRWGQVPEKDNPDKLSVTAIEYERAKKRKIPLLIFVSSYEKEEELMKFINRISDMEEGNWRVTYTDSADLIRHVIRGIPKLVDGIGLRQQETHQSSTPILEIFPSISSPGKTIEVNVDDVSEDIVNRYANIITTSSIAEVKDVAWRYLEKLAENRRIWNHAIVWSLLDSELLAITPSVLFFYASNILKWMLRNSKNDLLNRHNSTRNEARKHYLLKFKEILSSSDAAWDSYHRVEVKEILKDITEPDERCKIWWDAWKHCAKGIEDTDQYTRLTQSVSIELENSSNECRDSIRMEQIDIISNGQPPYFANRARQLHI